MRVDNVYVLTEGEGDDQQGTFVQQVAFGRTQDAFKVAAKRREELGGEWEEKPSGDPDIIARWTDGTKVIWLEKLEFRP